MTDPRTMRRVQAALTAFWLAMIPASIVAGWINSVAYVSALSLWALVASHGAWWAAASSEAKQVEQDVPGEVVHEMVTHTDVSAA